MVAGLQDALRLSVNPVDGEMPRSLVPVQLRILCDQPRDDLFQAVVTRDDVANPKPHPEPYLTAAARLGVPPGDCLAIEDSHSGVRAAHAAGMQTVMVPDLVLPTDEIAALCAAVMESLHAVHAAVFPGPGR